MALEPFVLYWLQSILHREWLITYLGLEPPDDLHEHDGGGVRASRRYDET